MLKTEKVDVYDVTRLLITQGRMNGDKEIWVSGMKLALFELES